MRAREAVEQIRNTIFKPGWTIEAEEYGYDLVYVRFKIDTVDTSYNRPDGTFWKPITVAPDTVFSVARMDETQLSWRLLQLALEVDEHESREFFKVRQPDGSWAAPFHPHTASGERQWAQGRARAA
jgi:hypothetical protein